MNETTLFLLDLAEGPIFRFAFALMILGLLRQMILSLSDAAAAYLTMEDRQAFRQKLRMRIGWFFFPSVVLRRHRPGGSTGMYVYHLCICCLSLVFRFTAILLPAFMAAHVYLWEQGFGIAWPALPAMIADVLSGVVIVSGALLFLARLYSPMLRKMEPAWSFLKPLILLVPFVSGALAMHPELSPISYHAMRLVHVLSAAVVFVMVPFTRMLSCVHTPLTRALPEASWQAEPQAAPAAAGATPGH